VVAAAQSTAAPLAARGYCLAVPGADSTAVDLGLVALSLPLPAAPWGAEDHGQAWAVFDLDVLAALSAWAFEVPHWITFHSGESRLSSNSMPARWSASFWRCSGSAAISSVFGYAPQHNAS